MKSVLAGLLISLTGTAWSGPVVVEVPVGTVIAAPMMAPVGIAGSVRNSGMGNSAAFRPVGSVRTQPGYNFSQAPAVNLQFAPAASFNSAESAVDAAPAFSPATSVELGQMSSEAAWQKAGEDFDANFYAKKAGSEAAPVVAPAAKKAPKAKAVKAKAPKAEAPRPPKTVNPSGKTETTKGHIPIHRPEEGQSTYEPGLYSPSRLGEFEWNKDDYAFHWVFRHKKNVPKHVSAFVGGIAHQTMENMGKWVRGGKSIDDISVEDMTEIFETLWDEQYVEGKHMFDPGTDEKSEKAYGRAFVVSLFERLRPTMARVNAGEVRMLFIEQKMFFTVDEESSGRSYRFQGIPDLVIMYEKDGKKIIEVTDYKTTKTPPTLPQLMAKEYQLTMYVGAIKQNFPDLAKDATFLIRYNYKDFMHVFEATPEFQKAANERVLTILHGIETFIEQVEANREEWERRLNPINPPKKMKEATKLVDDWTSLHIKMETLTKELKKLEAEADTIMEKLLAFAKATGNSVVPGKIKDAILDQKENVKAPTKSDDAAGYALLSKLIKEAGLWEEFSSLNLAEIKNVAKLAGHPHHALYEKIKHLVVIGMKQEMKLKDKPSEKKK